MKIDKLTIVKCKALLQKDGSLYSDAEIIQVRDFLYMLADLDYEVFLKQQIREKEFMNDAHDENNLKQAA